MASKNIKGITIKIGGETTQLTKALQGVDSQIGKTNEAIRQLDKALKLDPKNTELLSQKQKELAINIAASKDRIEQLKEAQRQMDAAGVDKNSDSYRALTREIATSQVEVKKMEEELKKTSKIDMAKLKEGLKKVGDVAVQVGKKIAQITAALGGALVAVGTMAVKSYASLEQNIGAIEKLYGKSANTLIENSKKAFKTAGISANQYMETATSFSASLLKGLGGNTQKAAALTDRAIRDMSDNANTFGSSMDDVMNVYKALSKEQYTTLDNLRLGYAGTKTGAKQMIKDAAEYAKQHKELGITVDANSMSFDNLINAISVTQAKLKITGTTQKEAEQTITGSLNTLKAAFDNFLNGTGSPEDLAKAVSTFLSNILTAFNKLLPNLVKGIAETAKKLLPDLLDMVWELVPYFLEELSNLISTILDFVEGNEDELAATIGHIVSSLIEFLGQNIPKLVKYVLTVYRILAKAFTDKDTLDIILKSIIECVEETINVLIECLPLFIEAISELIKTIGEYISDPDNQEYVFNAQIKIIKALAKLLITLIPVLLSAIWQVLVSIFDYLTASMGNFLDKGKEAVKYIAKGIKDKLPDIKEKAKEIIEKIKEELSKLPQKALEWGKDMMKGLIDGIKSKMNGVKDAAKNVADKIASYLHFSRPDEGALREYETWMPDFVRGLATTLRQSSGILEDASSDMANNLASSVLTNTSNALKGLKSGVSTSLNPTINPSMSYDLNYQLMALAMKEALKEVEVELDDRELGRFIDKQVSEEVYS